MNPMMVAKNRTARLVREASTPTYSTSTPKREHITAVEIESVYGRRWAVMPDNEVVAYLDRVLAAGMGNWLSDVDHAASCWCFA